MYEKQVRKELDEYKLSVLALQYQMPGNLKIRGYGKGCPLLMTNDVIELRSLQCFEHPIFGFHIGITLFGSKAARDVITRYATKFQVCIENVTAMLVTMLDNIQNQLIFNVEMVTDKGAKKMNVLFFV